MVSYINDTDFVIENMELVYPEIVTDGLQLYYDAKGKRDTDYHRDTMLDMSGNKNHGKLHNFAYEKNSGYKDGLVFDYIDDKLVRPTLDLKPDDFTFMLNGNIISFSPDGTVKRVQDGQVIESKGFNLIRNGNFFEGGRGWSPQNGSMQVASNSAKIKSDGVYGIQRIVQQNIPIPVKHKFYFYFYLNDISQEYITKTFQLFNPNGSITYQDGTVIKGSNSFLTQNNTSVDNFRATIAYTSPEVNSNQYFEVSNVGIINLTEAFGAGEEPTKEQMDEIINRFGFTPNAQDLIDRIEYKGNNLGDMENIIDGLYKTEVPPSEEIYTDKADDSVVHVGVDGKSYQHAGSGKNLFIGEAVTHHKQSDNVHWECSVLTYKRNNGNAYAGASFKLNVKTGVTYSLSLKCLSGKGYIRILDETDTLITDGFFSTGGSSINFTPTGTIAYIIFSDSSSENDNKIITNIQIEEGSTATDYEPPAPTPDYPIEIHSLNDFDVVSSVGNMNLHKGTSDEWREEYRPKGSYTFQQGTDIKLELGETYTFSVIVERVSDDTVPINLHFGIGNGDFSWDRARWGNIYNIPMGKKITRTFTVSEEDLSKGYENFAWRLRNELKETTIRFKEVKLEKSNYATPWTPNITEITEDNKHDLIDKINILLDEPLRSVGEVKDRLFRDTDGLWKVERNVKEFVVNGSENWMDWGNTQETHNSYYISLNTIDKRVSSSSHFTYNKGEANNSKVTGINVGGGADTTFNIGVPVTIATTLSEWKNWLGNNNVTFTAKLLNTTIETLTEDLQDKLNNLHSFEDSNYVYTVLQNEDSCLYDNLKPTLHAKFLYNNWYKEDRVINNLMIYNRALTNEEMLQNYKMIKRRWGM